MDSVNLEVLRAAIAWFDAGVPVTLVTVVKTWGSSPRPAGSLLAVSGDGRLVGSVSGGCIEDDLLDRLRPSSNQERPMRPEPVTYGVTAEQTRRFGLPCGGALQLVLEPLQAGHGLAEVLARIEAGELVARQLDLTSGKIRLLARAPDTDVIFDETSLITTFGPRWRLLIIGAGQLSHYLALFALALDYRVIISEPREEYRQSWSVPGTTLTTEMPDDAVTALQPDQRTAVVACTHDPKLDDLALIDALKTDAFYVGALGSRANSARRRERMRLFDLSEREIERLHGPVGLPIGSRTPPEIALAIMADLTARRHGVTLKAVDVAAPAKATSCPSLVTA
jgi:xanthine dehydrogenase accessory factor